jgi:phosphate transport system permease protein
MRIKLGIPLMTNGEQNKTKRKMGKIRIKPRTTDRIATVILSVVAGFMLILLLAFVIYIIYKGSSMLNLHFLTSPPSFGITQTGGIGPEIFNSIYLVFMSMIITVPIGVAAGIYMAEYAKPNALTSTIRFCIESLASLPSVVIGLFGFVVFVKMTGWHTTLFAGALTVSILNLPVITRLSEDAIRNVHKSLKEASLALGATQWQTIKRVLIPAAIPSLATGIIITAGRAFGEAAAVLFTAGSSASTGLNMSDWNPFSPHSLLNPFRTADTLSVYIYNVSNEVAGARSFADGAAAVLIIAVFVFNILSRILARALSAKFAGKNAD